MWFFSLQTNAMVLIDTTPELMLRQGIGIRVQICTTICEDININLTCADSKPKANKIVKIEVNSKLFILLLSDRVYLYKRESTIRNYRKQISTLNKRNKLGTQSTKGHLYYKELRLNISQILTIFKSKNSKSFKVELVV